jgi:hypothetical protein
VVCLGAGCSTLTCALWGYALGDTEAGRAAASDALIRGVVVATSADQPPALGGQASLS